MEHTLTMNTTLRVLAWITLPTTTIIALAVASPQTPTPAPAAPPAPHTTAAEIPPAGEDLGGASTTMSDEIRVTASPDRERIWAEDGTLRVSLRLQSSHDHRTTTRVPTDLVVVMDRSGSMSGEKIAHARAAAQELLAQLTPEDRFALVAYDSQAELTLPLAPVHSTHQRQGGMRIAALQPGGSTNTQEGLDLGLAQLEDQTGRAKRIILLSDGLPDSTDGLLERAMRAATAEAPLTTIGIGDDYDEQLMSRLADAGTGNFYWVNQQDDLATVFADEFSAARETVASALTIQLHDAGGHSHITEAGGYLIEQSETFKAGTLYAGQDRRLWLTLRVDPAHATAEGTLDPGALVVRWRDAQGNPQQTTLDLPPLTLTHSQSDFVAGLDAETWGQGLVEEEYNRMRADVSARVQAGDRDGAIAIIDSYHDRNRRLNDHVGSATVLDNLAQVQQLRSEVEDNFTGADQRARQNQWSKSTNMSAYSSRKVGQARQY